MLGNGGPARPRANSCSAPLLSDVAAWGETAPGDDRAGTARSPMLARMLAGDLPLAARPVLLQLDLGATDEEPDRGSTARRHALDQRAQCQPMFLRQGLCGRRRQVASRTERRPDRPGSASQDYPDWTPVERNALESRPQNDDRLGLGDRCRNRRGWSGISGRSRLRRWSYCWPTPTFRIVCCCVYALLGAEEGGKLPPVEIVFSPAAFVAQDRLRPRRSRKTPLAMLTGRDLVEDDPQWSATTMTAASRPPRVAASQNRPACAFRL